MINKWNSFQLYENHSDSEEDNKQQNILLSSEINLIFLVIHGCSSCFWFLKYLPPVTTQEMFELCIFDK